MSAIWGIIDFSKQNISKEKQLSFAKTYDSYAIDRVDSALVANALFSCGHQFLTPAASWDALPIYDKERNILFTCDGVLDNREELLAELPASSPDMGDGQLIYLAYLKWGASVCDHLLGAFTFAVYHINTNRCLLFTDHMSNRSLFYSFEDNILYFSTLIVPLQEITQSTLSEKWITACLSNTSANIALYEALTPFEGIYQCMAATYIDFTLGRYQVQEYWSPLKIKPDLKLASSTQYKEYFIHTIQQCVESQIRTTGQVSATLSGGLDSTTIAAFAASFLAAQDKTLFSYTSIPLEDFEGSSDSYAITDESQKVLEFCKMYSNIKPSFLSCVNKDGFTSLPELIPYIGYPMKSAHNLTWLNEVYAKAHADGCTLILKGQYGNSTLSYGPALTVFYQLLLQGKWNTMYKSIHAFQKHYKVPLKNIVLFMIKELWGHIHLPEFNYEDSLVPQSLLKEHHIPTTMKDVQRIHGTGNMDSRSQRMNFLFDRCSLGQLGMFDTVMGLTYHLMIRDPAKDKRIVVLCSQMPVKYYLAGGLERGLIRTFMRGQIPDSILLDIHHRGLQSADNHYRIQKNWHLHKERMLSILQSDLMDDYIALDIKKELLEEICCETELSPYTTRKLNVLYSFGLFLEIFERKHADE